MQYDTYVWMLQHEVCPGQLVNVLLVIRKVEYYSDASLGITCGMIGARILEGYRTVEEHAIVIR